MANMKKIKADAKKKAADTSKNLGVVAVLDNISDLLTYLCELIDQNPAVMEFIQNIALVAELGEVAKEKTVAAGATKSSSDGLVHTRYSPGSYSYKLSPAELKELFENVPKAIKISKSLLKEAAPELYVKYSDDAHKVEVKKAYAALTDSRGLIAMYEIFLQLAVRETELQAIYGQE